MPDVAGPVLVTGATGFVGSHLVDALVEEGRAARCLVRRTSSLRWLPTDQVELARASFDDPRALERVLTGVSVVFHLAGLTSAAAPADYDRVNVGGTQRLLDAMSAHAPEAALVFCSSLAAAGPARGEPLTESDPPHPIGPYGASKLAAERLIERSGMRHVIVRPPAVYGPRDRDVLAAFRLAARGLAPRVGPSDQRLSMVHARDLARALISAAACGVGRGVYYVSDGIVHTWSTVTGAIASAVGRRVRAVPIAPPLATAAAHMSRFLARLTGSKPLLTPERVRDLQQADWSCDDSRARAELGYRSAVTLAEGMRETARWYAAQGWL